MEDPNIRKFCHFLRFRNLPQESAATKADFWDIDTIYGICVVKKNKKTNKQLAILANMEYSLENQYFEENVRF